MADPASPVIRDEDLLAAAEHADWMQVVLNQGPPCFHLEGTRFCLRAWRWDGHKPQNHDIGHAFVSLADLLRARLAVLQRVEQLPAQWRKDAQEAQSVITALAIHECAIDVERALTAPAPEAPPPNPCHDAPSGDATFDGLKAARASLAEGQRLRGER